MIRKYELDIAKQRSFSVKDPNLFFFFKICKGIICGFFFFVNLSESWGRKRTLKVFILVGGLSLICAGVTQTYYILIITFFLFGLAYKGFENVYFIYISEISCKKKNNYLFISKKHFFKIKDYQKFLDQSNEINIIAFSIA